ETHFPTFRHPSQAHSRLSCPHEDPWRSRRHQCAPRQGSQTSGRLSPTRTTKPASAGVPVPKRASFPPAARLHRPSEFAAALRGKHLARGPMFVVSTPRGTPNDPATGPRLGMVIAKRMAPLAVSRNTIKRVIRECFRQRRHELPPRELVLRLHTRIEPCSPRELKTRVRDEIETLLARSRPWSATSSLRPYVSTATSCAPGWPTTAASRPVARPMRSKRLNPTAGCAAAGSPFDASAAATRGAMAVTTRCPPNHAFMAGGRTPDDLTPPLHHIFRQAPLHSHRFAPLRFVKALWISDAPSSG